MKKHLVSAAGLLACTALYLSATPAGAVDVGIGIGIPGVFVQGRLENNVHPVHERDWREHQERAHQWWYEQQVRDRHDEHDHYDRNDHDRERGHDRGMLND